MAMDILEKEIDGLSESDMKMLMEFVHYLKFRVNASSMAVELPNNDHGTERKIGFLSDAFVSIDR